MALQKHKGQDQAEAKTPELVCGNGYEHHNGVSLDIVSLDTLKSFSGNFSVSIASVFAQHQSSIALTACGVVFGLWMLLVMLHKGKGFLLGQRALVVISVQSKYQLLPSNYSQQRRIHCLSRKEMFTWKFPLWSLKRSTNTYFGSGIAGMTDF